MNSSSSRLPSLFLEQGQLLIYLMSGSCKGEIWKFKVSAEKIPIVWKHNFDLSGRIFSTCPGCGISFQLAPLPRLLKIPATKKRDSINIRPKNSYRRKSDGLTWTAYIRQKISTISSRSISPELSLSYIRNAHLRRQNVSSMKMRWGI